MIELISTEFQKYLNQAFIVHFDENTHYEVELIEVKESQKIEGLGRTPFSLLFKAPIQNKIYTQGMYTLKHSSGMEYPLFMIPRAPDKEYIYYEIIIN